ncbi:KDO2-lipid IV(A) lauroyltransferase [Rhodobacter aestuarii]|uniref:KDO2-lipid IV(A) lauroyltransferase n=1 Tax=Rhodobacter aestuarii TaxID=453582 RepID=A0A1N7QA34_9RHOB|nr:lysophospholipid acyltransferase family protein [Rhodobacter aestuarii]PTV93790.1 KDO2-lipid IV(A) lauroyltransferase [Rhodobacter aestuarii]SIT19569.1 KDO2-lipid IV(A) lauroyltransferase [Rhodobacter aestuarii]
MAWNADRTSDAFLRVLIGLARRVPYKTRVRLFGWLTGWVVAPLAGYISKAVRNLQLIHPEMSSAEAKRIARRVSVNFGRSIIENYSKDDLSEVLKNSTVGGPGLAAFKDALAEGRGVLAVSGHIGNYETLRVAIHNMGYPVAALYRPAKNPYFNEHYKTTMESLTGPAFAQSRKGVVSFTRHVKNGGVAAMLFDVRATSYPDISFFGYPAPTSTFAAEMAMKTGALLLPIFTHRCEDGIHHDVHFETPIAHTNPREMTEEMTRRLEAQIRSFPDQWLWVHDRWGSEDLRARRANRSDTP